VGSNDSIAGTFITGLVVCLVIAVLTVGGIAGCGAFKGWQRGQRRADARNRVQITKIEIQNQDQQAKVVNAQNGIVAAQAQQRYIQATGVRRAQDEIAKTLTPLYIQWDAIQALLKLGESGRNNTVVYLPSGQGRDPFALGFLHRWYYDSLEAGR
jgi:hypothetical protein